MPKGFLYQSGRVLIIGIFVLAVIFAVIGGLEIWGKAWFNVATIVLAVLIAVVAIIVYLVIFVIPITPKQKARREMQKAINNYVILQSLQADQGPKNRVMNKMCQLARDAHYSCKEIADYLQSRDGGERSAALASIQWQWSKDKGKVYDATNFSFSRPKSQIPLPPNKPDKNYFPQLLEMLCNSWDRFENYHATVAMWSMLDSLETPQIQKLSDSVIGKDGRQECPLYYKCKEWSKFIDDLQKPRP